MFGVALFGGGKLDSLQLFFFFPYFLNGLQC